MNLFFLDKNPIKAAQMHCDKHVIKMIVETTQMLSTTHHVLGSDISGPIYKSTHINHPSTFWVRQSLGNYKWAASLALALTMEYTYRYGRRHATEIVLANVLDPPDRIKFGDITPIPQCMPDQYKGDDPVEAYRRYYKGEKANFARWTKRPIPEWWTE